MLWLLCTLVALAPFSIVLGLLALTARRERRRREVQDRQIALTDAIHERLGAAAAPLVNRRRRRWEVRMAVPLQCPATTEALLAIVLEAFAPGDRRSVEIILTRQPHTPMTPLVGGRDVRQESLSWT